MKQTTKQNEDTRTIFFPQQLMAILSDPFYHNAITWLPSGKAFYIANKHKLESEVLPKYFRKSKTASFVRKLNRWGFKRCTKGPDIGAYNHEFFQRDKKAMCTQMYCMNDRNKFASSQETSSKKELRSSSISSANRFKENADTTKPLSRDMPAQVTPRAAPKVQPNLLSNDPVDPDLVLRKMLLRKLIDDLVREARYTLNDQQLRELFQSR